MKTGLPINKIILTNYVKLGFYNLKIIFHKNVTKDKSQNSTQLPSLELSSFGAFKSLSKERLRGRGRALSSRDLSPLIVFNTIYRIGKKPT